MNTFTNESTNKSINEFINSCNIADAINAINNGNTVVVSANYPSALLADSELTTKAFLTYYVWNILNDFNINCYCSSHPNKIQVLELIQDMKQKTTPYSGYLVGSNFSNGMLKYIYNSFNESCDKLRELTFCNTCKCACLDQIKLCNIMQEMIQPLTKHHENCPKLIRDFQNLQTTLENYEHEPICKRIKTIINNMLAEIPNTYINNFMTSFKDGCLKIQYNRLIRLLKQLNEYVNYPNYCESSVKNFKIQINKIFDDLADEGAKPMAIPKYSKEFFSLWRSKAFDDRDINSILPEPSMFRFSNCSNDSDIWLIYHSDHLQYMSALKFWRCHSPLYSTLIEIISGTLSPNFPYAVLKIYRKYCGTCLAIINNCECNECNKFDIDDRCNDCNASNSCLNLMPAFSPSQDDWNIVKRWDLTVVPENPSLVYPNRLFKELYLNTLKDFCKYAELSDAERTSKYFKKLKMLSVRIGFMDNWIKHSLQIAINSFQQSLLRCCKILSKYEDDDCDGAAYLSLYDDMITRSEKGFFHNSKLDQSETETETETDQKTDQKSELESETDQESELETETDKESELESESDNVIPNKYTDAIHALITFLNRYKPNFYEPKMTNDMHNITIQRLTQEIYAAEFADDILAAADIKV